MAAAPSKGKIIDAALTREFIVVLWVCINSGINCINSGLVLNSIVFFFEFMNIYQQYKEDNVCHMNKFILVRENMIVWKSLKTELRMLEISNGLLKTWNFFMVETWNLCFTLPSSATFMVSAEWNLIHRFLLSIPHNTFFFFKFPNSFVKTCTFQVFFLSDRDSFFIPTLTYFQMVTESQLNKI